MNMADQPFAGLPVKSISIENLLAQRDSVLKRIGDGLAILREAQEIAEASGITGRLSWHAFVSLLYGRDAWRTPDLLEETAMEGITKRVDAAAWDHLMHESGMLTLMDAKAREDWRARIEKLECPPLTMDNIRATFGDLYAARDEIFERGVIACFKSLSWNYKTNRPFRFGKRIVRSGLRASVKGGSGLGFPNSYACDQLNDLIRVLSVLDGKPEPDHRHGVSVLLHDARNRNERDVDTEYLHIRSFRNGNGHVTFKRMDLVEKMNRIIAKHYPGALPYDQHVDEEEA